MDQILEHKTFWGKLTLLGSKEQKVFVVRPSGIIHPELVKLDLAQAEQFGKECKSGWKYIVDTSKVVFPHPCNLFYLKKISKLPFMKEYIIYAPSLPVRILGKLTEFIIKPNRIIKSEQEFEELLLPTSQKEPV